MAGFDPTEFGISIRRKIVDGTPYFVGSVAELSDIEVFEDSYQEAYDEVINVVVALYEKAMERGREFPKPNVPDEEYSGRVTLRLPRSMHKKSAQIAKLEDVSLNQYLVAVVAEAIGAQEARPSKPMLITHIINTQTAIARANQDNLIVVGTMQTGTALHN